MTTVILEGKEYQLDIEQAKKLDLLKEKDNRVRSWEEFVKKYSCSPGYSYNLTAKMLIHSATPIYTTDQLTPHEAKALSAFSQLLKLRRDWIGEWRPDWEDNSPKYLINVWRNHICFEVERNSSAALSFPTEKMAKDFLETFRELIKEAQTLI